MFFLICWLIVVAAAIGVNIWYYAVTGEVAVNYIPMQTAIVILEGIICLNSYLAFA